MIREKNVKIVNETGLHARPAAQFVKKASQFKSDIEIVFENKEVNAKSIMGLMSLGIAKGSEILIRASGDDAEKALAELVEYVEVKIAEEEE